MERHGETIMQACAVAIESTSSPTPLTPSDQLTANHIHTHALCVLACVAAGDEAKTALFENDNLLMKIVEYLCASSDEVSLEKYASVYELAISPSIFFTSFKR